MRIGSNPQRDKKVNLGDYFHQVIVPVYIPNLEDYYKDSFEVFKLSVQSIIKTTHNKTFISVISNGSCNEVNEYINELYVQNKIHEFVITKAIGKVNSILKGLSGISIPLVTITDADVLFLNNWQNATYEVFNHFPRAGVVGLVPNPSLSFYETENIFRDNFFSKNIQFSKIKDREGLLNFANSIGDLENFINNYSEKYLTISDKNNFKAVIGSGHFVATYKTEIFNINFTRSTEFLLGGKSETDLLDKKANQSDLWRLTTEDNYAYHLGNTVSDWVEEVFNKLIVENKIYDLPKYTIVKPLSFFKRKYVNISYRLFSSNKIRKLIKRNFKQ